MQKSKRNKQVCFWRNNLITLLMLAILLIVGFFYRVYGLIVNHSFWTDEEHVAIFARAILERGKPVLVNGYSTGVYQWLQYWLSAISTRIFGLNEFAIRFPSVIFGVLTIWAVYLLGKELFNRNVGLISAFFITFLKIEILWSRQARPYQALQFFYLLGTWFLYKLSKKDKFEWKYFAGFLGCGILASLMHGLGLVVFFSGFFYLLLFRFSWLKKLILPAILLFLFFDWIFRIPVFSVFSQIGRVNNLFYYRVFLTHNYLLLCLLALIGGLWLVVRKKKEWQILVLFLAIQGFIISFLLPQPFTRYFYIVFPFLVLLSAFGLWQTSKYLGSLIKRPKYLISSIQYLILFALVFSVVTFGHKFTLLPQKTYSLNEDMQEIPEVDWKKIYGFTDEKLKQNPGSVLVTNWSDLSVWYLGEGKPDFLVRKDVGAEKDIFSKAMILSDLNSFRELVKNEKKGLIIIDSWDNAIPDGLREYCRDSLKKELKVDRLYPVQPRYWPVEVYSWGI